MQNASEELSLVNMALKEELQKRTILQERLAAEIQQGDKARHASLHDPLTGLPTARCSMIDLSTDTGSCETERHFFGRDVESTWMTSKVSMTSNVA